jgi:hypothetical protein
MPVGEAFGTGHRVGLAVVAVLEQRGRGHLRDVGLVDRNPGAVGVGVADDATRPTQVAKPEQAPGAGRSPAANLPGETPMTSRNSAVMWDWS